MTFAEEGGRKYSIVYYFDFNGTSTCKEEILETNLTYDVAMIKQKEYAEYFFENTLSEQGYIIEDAYEAYKIFETV